MKNWIMCGLLLGSLQCQHPTPTRHYSLWIDPSFSDLQTKDICRVVGEQSNNTFDGFASDPDGPNTIALYATNHSQASSSQASKIYIDAALGEGRFLATTRYELEHVLRKQ